MSTDHPSEAQNSHSDQSGQPPIVVNVPSQDRGLLKSWATRLLFSFLLLSVLLNFVLMSAQADFKTGPQEEFVSGDEYAEQRIAIIDVDGTIMPPYTGKIIEMIEKARDDENVKGVVLAVDSPGGLVADSHQIYHELKELDGKKPIYVSMKRMAASGGVYVAMGAGADGKIYAEPTTWTGSIGVIIPRYDLTGLADKVGVEVDSLTTSPLKDALNPLKPMSQEERDVWREIMLDAFDRFVKIVAEGREELDEETVREKLATGQVFTASQAVSNGLIDEIGFEDDVVDNLQNSLGLSSVRVVRYQTPPTLMDVLMGNARARDPEVLWRKFMESTVPRAMYYCSWMPSL